MSCSAAWNLEKISTWNKNVFKLPSVKDSNEKVIKDNVRHIFWSQKNFSKWESQVEVQRKWKEKEGKNSVWKRRGKARANWVSEYWDAVESITTHYYCHLWVFRILAEKNVWCDPHYNSHCVLYLFFCIKTDGKQGPEEKKLQKKWKMSLFAFHRGTTRSQKKNQNILNSIPKKRLEHIIKQCTDSEDECLTCQEEVIKSVAFSSTAFFYTSLVLLVLPIKHFCYLHWIALTIIVLM